MLFAIGSPAAWAAESTYRDLVRKYVADKSQGVQPANLPGLAAKVEDVMALESTVMLRKNGEEQRVDANEHEFEIGDEIRVRIKPVSQCYIYIFYEGASGARKCLLPADDEKAPLAKVNEELALPSDGSVFEFTPPAGEDKLIVVATEQPSEDLAALANVVFKKPEDQLSPAEKTLHDSLKGRSDKTLKSIRERQAQGTKYRGLFDEEAVSKVSAEVQSRGTTRAILEEPPTGKQSSTFAMAASFQKGKSVELFVTIPLRSIHGHGSPSN
ncbi:MAG TPA: DUF4384 domain-containing protein, partial [Pirellulales bacterium]|nr:DUF4384 domain-containing protein [Pirellulales bacterium]